MSRRRRTLVALTILAWCGLLGSPPARADGGAVRAREQCGPYQVTVFTSPTPFRAGLVDISVFVQDDSTGECVLDAKTTVQLKNRETSASIKTPATTEAATNKLFRAAVFTLPSAGWWDGEVLVETPRAVGRVRFQAFAGPPIPRWADYWPWFAWPPLVAALFVVHQSLLKNRATRGSSTRKTVTTAAHH